MWANIAASRGNKKFIKTRENVSKKLTVGQITEAQELARTCVENDYKNCTPG